MGRNLNLELRTVNEAFKIRAIIMQERAIRRNRCLLSILQMSVTVLKTTLEKLTVIWMVFILGSCSSRGLCWGV